MTVTNHHPFLCMYSIILDSLHFRSSGKIDYQYLEKSTFLISPLARNSVWKESEASSLWGV